MFTVKDRYFKYYTREEIALVEAVIASPYSFIEAARVEVLLHKISDKNLLLDYCEEIASREKPIRKRILEKKILLAKNSTKKLVLEYFELEVGEIKKMEKITISKELAEVILKNNLKNN